MLVELFTKQDVSTRTTRTDTSARMIRPAQVVFDTLPTLGMDRMTAGRVEFVLCASALTAQV